MRLLNASRRPSIALDVGTAMIRGCSKRSGIVERPSYVASNESEIHGLRGGVVCDVTTAAETIAPVVRAVGGRWLRPNAIVCAPTDATAEERELLVDAVREAGASVATVVAEPLAAAIGAGLDVGSEYAQLIADIGEGVVDVAVIRGAEVRASFARRTGCSEIRRPLIDFLRRHEGIAVSERAADEIITALCRRGASDDPLIVSGRRVDGTAIVPCRLSREHSDALVQPALDAIREFILRSFLRLPDRWAAEVIETGLLVTGGGAMLEQLVDGIESATGLAIQRAPNPYRSVIAGAREMLRSGVRHCA